MRKILTIDPSGTGTTGILIITNNVFEFSEFQNSDWQEHLKYLIQLIQHQQPQIIIYEDTTYIYGRQHQGTVGLYKLLGGIVSLGQVPSATSQVTRVTVNQVKAFKKQLFTQGEQIEGLTYEVGRGKGWKYRGQKLSLHCLDCLVIYHLWSHGSLESKKSIRRKIKALQTKKRLGVRQKEQLAKLEKFWAEGKKTKQ